MLPLQQQIRLIILLSNDHHHHHHTTNPNINRIYVDKAYHSKEGSRTRNYQKKDITHILDIEEKKNYFVEKNILQIRRWVVEKEQIHGIIDSENCLQDMRRKTRIILVLWNSANSLIVYRSLILGQALNNFERYSILLDCLLD